MEIIQGALQSSLYRNKMQINIIIYIVAFIFGAIIGSFLNVVIFRLKINKDDKAKINLRGRSKCPHCQKTLDAFELIPILSYFVLGGKCRGCKKPISYQYPLVEFISALLTVLPIYLWGFSHIYIYLIIPIFYLFIIIFFYDLKNFIIPDVLLVLLFLIILIFDIIKLGRSEISLVNLFWGVIIGGGLFLLLVIFSREKWMGWGDVKLGFLLGLLLGYPYIVVSLFLSFISGALVSIILIFAYGRKLKSQIPFAPFLILGAMIAIFWGEKIINWYLGGF
ncbi:MAG: leader peptidase (prepilin peptidase) / N-methyltransferase [Candidatus Berkelbacteria bacterium Licking1014_96]|uniref:Leader peptidase (Prepilin peptidase) / N-methyltransferase n=1 Tax=Candidatus Berkelbacteria bacterium Licking1014_96 TaxID=2017149 RepID=A0A554LFR7_9BACT|nr:MAG: leader peptidase (prepilin peptidase) / N-methyltransferase [Candidatus Berkelbacteria bacterium Licking1014_96]